MNSSEMREVSLTQCQNVSRN